MRAGLATAALVLAARALADECVVTSLADTVQPGTLRACLTAVGEPRHVTFAAPGTVRLTGQLPPVRTGGVFLDARDAGVSLDCGGKDVGVWVQAPDVRIEGLTIHGCRGSGFNSGVAVRVDGAADRITLRGLTIFDNDGSGVFVGLERRYELRIEDSVFRDNRFDGIHVQRDARADAGSCAGPRSVIARNSVSNAVSGNGEGGIFLVGVDCFDVVENEVGACDSTGIKVTASSNLNRVIRNTLRGPRNDGFGIYGGAHHNELLGNLVERAGRIGVNIGDDGTTDNVVAGTLVIASAGPGINAYTGGRRNAYVHNTAIGNAEQGIVLGPNTEGTVVRNNLMVGNAAGLRIVNAANREIDHNLAFGNDTNFIGVPDDLVCDPSLDGGAPSTCASCAIDRGAVLEPTLQPDLTGEGDLVSFWGAAPDVGAIESECGRPPRLTLAIDAPRPARCERPWQLTVRVTDGGVAPLSFTLKEGPVGASIDSESGVLSWVPPSGVASGAFVVQVTSAVEQVTRTVDVPIDCGGERPQFRVSCGHVPPLGLSALVWGLARRRRRR